jgi:4a-hydroxytetrahydrobiopterin dehydratase
LHPKSKRKSKALKSLPGWKA